MKNVLSFVLVLSVCLLCVQCSAPENEGKPTTLEAPEGNVDTMDIKPESSVGEISAGADENGDEAAENEEQPSENPEDEESPSAGVPPLLLPMLRVTCDIFDNMGHKLCAAHCILKGYKGGWCDARRVCNCRN